MPKTGENMKKTIICHAAQIVTPEGVKAKHGKDMKALKIIEDGAIYIEDDRIKAVGTTQEILKQYGEKDKADIHRIDASGSAVIPGFVDSHTHFVFDGYRPTEFLQVLQGTAYMEILKNGGGIQSTVEATQKASFDELYQQGMKRLEDMLSMGVTTVEGKSGYGLDLECECKQLEVMKALNEQQPVDIVATYLGAHAIPKKHKDNPDAYIRFMIQEVLPIIKQKSLAEFVDVFCEEGVFDIKQSKQLLLKAKEMGFDTKIHADEIVSLGGGELAANINAVSADHLLGVSDRGIEKLSKKDTVTTLLPCTAFCLNKPFAPARKMIDEGCAVAIASDYNPGSCFTNSIALLIALAVIKMRMTVEEALCALTLNAAAAVKRSHEVGTIEVGKKADILLLEYPDYQFLAYHTGRNIVKSVIKNGIMVYNKHKIEARDAIWKIQ